MHFYLIGIKGTGMSALANILVDIGHEVSGVDYNKKYFTEATFRKSIKVDSFENIKLRKDYFYIIGNAFKLSDIASKIKDSGYEFSYYPQFLESFFKMKKIGISGSHGKTTTTYFASQLIGSKINALIGDGSGVGNDDAEYFLFEACEYQNHFLNYTYDFLVILNIDYDHPDFFKSANEYVYAFQKAALKSEVLIMNYDDENFKKIVHKNMITFGFNPNADVVLKLIENNLILTFDEEKYVLPFNFYGKHMAYNLAVAFMISFLIGKDSSNIIDRIPNLKLPARRLTEHKIKDDVILVSDYAHHPTEIKALILSLRSKYPDMKLTIIYQGHTFSRTNAFLNEYVSALKEADLVYIMPIFSSVREEEHDEWILLNQNKSFKKYSKSIKEELINQSNIVIAFLGAGDIDNEFNFFK